MLEEKVELRYMDLSTNAVHSQYWKVGMVQTTPYFCLHFSSARLLKWIN